MEGTVMRCGGAAFGGKGKGVLASLVPCRTQFKNRGTRSMARQRVATRAIAVFDRHANSFLVVLERRVFGIGSTHIHVSKA